MKKEDQEKTSFITHEGCIAMRSYQNIDQHFEDLDKILKILYHYRIKLNLDKYVFRVKVRKLLVFSHIEGLT